MNRLVYLLFAIFTAMISWELYHNVVLVIAAWIFAPIAWICWLIGHEVTLTVIKHTFAWFFV